MTNLNERDIPIPGNLLAQVLQLLNALPRHQSNGVATALEEVIRKEADRLDSEEKLPEPSADAPGPAPSARSER